MVTCGSCGGTGTMDAITVPLTGDPWEDTWHKPGHEHRCNICHGTGKVTDAVYRKLLADRDDRVLRTRFRWPFVWINDGTTTVGTKDPW